MPLKLPVHYVTDRAGQPALAYESALRKLTYVHCFRQGWYVSADFVNRVWTVHHQPADHWRALQLPTVLQQLSKASDLVTCQDCIQHEFHPAQCSQANQNGGKCVVLLAGHKGIFQNVQKEYFRRDPHLSDSIVRQTINSAIKNTFIYKRQLTYHRIPYIKPCVEFCVQTEHFTG